MRTSRYSHFSALASLLAAAALASCSRQPTPPVQTASGNQTFEVRGVLQGIGPGGRSVTVEHEDIPGFMPSMTMPFSLKEPKELHGLSVGKAVAFQLVVTGSDSWIAHLREIGRDAVTLPENALPTKNGGLRLKEGDRLPEFHLVDQDNQPVNRETLSGKTTLLTFLFTRCPLPTYCPLMSRNFSQLQKRIAADAALAGRVRLLSISFDPQDSPETLARYAAGYSADPASWRYVGGAPEETGKLTHAFSVYVQAEGGSFSHGLCTALVLPDGTVGKIWRGNDWSVDEVWQTLETLANR